MIMTYYSPHDMGSYEAHKPDDPQEGHGDRGGEGRDQHTLCPDPVRVNSQTPGCVFPTLQAVVIPGMIHEIDKDGYHEYQHDPDIIPHCPAHVTEGPEYGGCHLGVGGKVL